jgi:hypothetical protein
MPLPRLPKSERRRVQLCRRCASGVIRVDVRATISDMAHPDLIRSARRHAFSCEQRPWPKGPVAAIFQ